MSDDDEKVESFARRSEAASSQLFGHKWSRVDYCNNSVLFWHTNAYSKSQCLAVWLGVNLNHLIPTLKPQNNRPIYSNTVITVISSILYTGC